MTSKLLVISLASAAAHSFSYAEELGIATSAPPQKYLLKSRSKFELPAGTRAPFLPVGWAKGAVAVAAVVEAPKPVLTEKMFRVTSISLGSPSLAVINGRAYSEGEFIRMGKLPVAAGKVSAGGAPGASPRVRVQRISDGVVVLQADQQQLTVRLSRPELESRRPELETLSEER